MATRNLPAPVSLPGRAGRALAVACDQAGLRRAYLEVTAENAGAVRLYRAVGFRRAKTLYKAVDG